MVVPPRNVLLSQPCETLCLRKMTDNGVNRRLRALKEVCIFCDVIADE